MASRLTSIVLPAVRDRVKVEAPLDESKRVTRLAGVAGARRPDIIPAMSDDARGMLFSLLAALSWASALIMFKRSGEHYPPLALNLFKNTVALLLLAGTVLIQGNGFEFVSKMPPEEVVVLMASGLLGIALADSLFFYSLHLLGVSIIVVVECLYSPSVILCAWILLDERVTAFHLMGGGLILAGVIITSRHKLPPDRTRGQIVLGVLLGAAAMASMACGITWAKPIIERTPILWSTLIRLGAGTVALAAFMVATSHRGTIAHVFRPSRAWRFAVPGGVVGTYLCLMFWIGGFKYTDASVAAILNQTATLFAVVFAAIFLQERITVRKIVALGLAVVGVAVVTFSGRLSDALWPPAARPQPQTVGVTLPLASPLIGGVCPAPEGMKMSVNDDLVVGFELHDPQIIRGAIAAGASPTAPIGGKRPVDVLIEMYQRSDRIAACLRVLLDAGATVGDALLEAILLDDEAALRRVLSASPRERERRLSLPCAYTFLTGVSPLHICAEYNSVKCARVLIDAGVDVNVRADADRDGIGGQTPLFHTVNSNHNHCRPMMELLVEAGADLDVRLRGLVWGGGFAWETVVFDVTPISYAQCGLYAQFHRRDEDIYGNITYLYLRVHGASPPIRNVPNRYLLDARVFPPKT